MEAWTHYRLTDFVLFSERVYWRLFEQMNEVAGVYLAPLIALGCLLLAGLWSRRRSARVATAWLLAALWVSSTLLFVWQYYTPINWAARYVIPFLLLQACLLVVLSITRHLSGHFQRNQPRAWVGVALLGYAVFIHPLSGLMFGRTLGSAEIVGLSLDATTIATLGWVLVTGSRLAHWLLLPIPTTVCLLSGSTLYALGTAEGWVLAIALTLTFAALLMPTLNLRTSNSAIQQI